MNETTSADSDPKPVVKDCVRLKSQIKRLLMWIYNHGWLSLEITQRIYNLFGLVES